MLIGFFRVSKYPSGMSATSKPAMLKRRVVFLDVMLTDEELVACVWVIVSSVWVKLRLTLALCILLHTSLGSGAFAIPLIPGSRTNP